MLAKPQNPFFSAHPLARSPQSMPMRYGMALVSVAAALVGTLAVRSVAPRVTFLLFIGALLFSTAYGGWGPGLLCLLAVVSLCDYLFFEPVHTLRVIPADFYALVTFFCVGVVVIGVTEALRASNRRIATAYERAEGESRRYCLLCRISKTLLSAREVEPVLREVAQAVTADFADWCLIDLLNSNPLNADGTLHNAAISCRDPRRRGHAAKLKALYPRPPGVMGASADVARSGHIKAAYHVTETFLQATAHDPAELEVLQSLDITSYLCLPLLSQGKTLGALTLFSCGADRQFRLADLDAALDLASRLALTVRGAQERSVSATTMESS